MQLQIKNFRKVEKADIDIATVTLVAGHNEAGKTSIAQAMAATLTGKPNVLSVTKKEADALVRDGSTDSAVRLKNDKGESVLKWPSMTTYSDGTPPAASEIAAGMLKFCELKKDIAASIICAAMKSDPSKQDLFDVVTPISGQKAAEKIWSMIEKQGWDATHAATVEQGRELKAEWKIIARDQWGSKKGETWVPQGFAYDLETADEGELQKAILDAERTLEESIAVNAVAASQVADLKTKATDYPNLVKERKEILAEIEKAQEAVDKAEAELSLLVKPGNSQPLTCPHCGAESLFDGKALVIGECDSEEMEKRKEQYETATAAVSAARTELALWQGKKAVNAPKGKAAQQAIEEIARMEKEGLLSEDEKDTTDKSQEFRQNVQTARERMDMFLRWRRAGETHRRIINCEKIADELSKSGLRQRKAEKAVEEFNADHLQPLCQKFAIPPIMIDLDMNVRYRTHLYYQLSESAKFRVNTVLQCALAKLDGSDAIVVDGADIIIGKDRAGIIAMLEGNGIPALLCMTMANAANTPDLSNIGGSVYWVENSMATRIEKVSQ